MRERLGRYFGQTHCFTGVFLNYSKTPEGSNVACFRWISIGKVPVADHVWIHRSKHMKQLELMAGDVVQFEARVGRYSRGIPRPHAEEIEYDFCLEKIKEIVVLKRHMKGQDSE